MTRRRGFTLIGLPIVIIGIVASIAIVKFAAMREKVYVARMIADLRHRAVSEEAYFADAGTYSRGGLPSALLVFSPAAGVTRVHHEVSGAKWSATAQSVGTARPGMVFYGNAAPVVQAIVEGVSACMP